MPRDRAIDLGHLAMAQLRIGNLEAGCESGRQAVDLLSGHVWTPHVALLCSGHSDRN